MFLLSDFDKIFIIAIAVTLVLSAVLFFLGGFIFNKKDSVFIVERLGKYYGTYNVKAKYFFPLLYRRVGVYRKGSYKEEIVIDNEKYFLEYRIINFETFHYSGHDFSNIIDELKGLDDKKTHLESRLSEVGIKLLEFSKL